MKKLRFIFLIALGIAAFGITEAATPVNSQPAMEQQYSQASAQSAKQKRHKHKHKHKHFKHTRKHKK